MTDTVTALVIPVDGRNNTVTDMPTSESGSCLEGLREQLNCRMVAPVGLEYEDEQHGIIHVDFWFDEEGFFTNEPVCNLLAMHIMDAILGTSGRLRQPYVGNCVVTALNPETGDTISLPPHAIVKLKEILSTFSPVDAYQRIYQPIMGA